jgi:hypothetical protein
MFVSGMFLGWSSTKLLFFVPVGYSTWLPGPIICSDWLKFQRSSSLKLLSHSQPNFAEMILGWPPSKNVSGDPDFQPRWPLNNSSYLEWRAGLSDTILKGNHLGIIPARFGLIWFSGFRGEDLNAIFYGG